MNLASGFPVPDAPICDPQTGQPTRVWVDWLRNQYMRTGGALGPGEPADVVQGEALLAAFGADIQDDPARPNDAALLGTLLSDSEPPPLAFGASLRYAAAAPPYVFTSGQEQWGFTARNSNTTSMDVLANSSFTHFDAVQGVAVLNAGSSIVQANGIAGYVLVNTPTDASIGGGGGAWVGSALFGAARSTVDGSSVWGGALLVQDGGAGNGTGRALNGFEIDVNPTQINTAVMGLIVTGGGTVQPTVASAVYIGRVGPGGVWKEGLKTYDGGTNKAVYVGTSLPPGTNPVGGDRSQILAFKSLDAAFVARETWITAGADGLHIYGDNFTGLRNLTMETGSLALAKQAAAPTASYYQYFYSNDAGAVQQTVSMQAVGGKTLTITGTAGAAVSLVVGTTAPAYTFASGELFGISSRNSSATGANIAASIFGSTPSFVDGVQGVVVLNAGSTITQVNGIAGYARVNCTSTGGGGASVGVAVAGFTETTVDNSAGWGSAIAVSDTGAGTGAGRTLIGGEYDFNITKAATKVTGMLLTGASSVQPTDSSGYVVGGLGANRAWVKAFVSLDVVASVGLSLGLASPPGSIVSKNSQTAVFRATTAGSAVQETWLYSDAAGLILTGDGSGAGGGSRSLKVPNGKVAVTTGPSAPSAITTTGTGVTIQNSNVAAPSLYTYLYGQDGLSSTLAIESGSTVIQANALSGLIRNRNPTGTVGVCLNFFATAEVDGARTWGTAGVLQDTPSSGTDTGTGAGRLLQNEWDFHVTHAATQVVGLVLTMDVLAGGSQPTNADGFIAGAVPGGRWINGFRSYDNQAVNFATVGMSGGTSGTANLKSQPVVFTGTNAAGAYQQSTVVFNGTANALELGGASLAVTAGSLIQSTIINLVPIGTTQAGAAALSASFTQLAGAAGTGVRLPAGSTLYAGGATSFEVWNSGAASILLYPAVGEQFADRVVNAPQTVQAGGRVTVWYPGAGTIWAPPASLPFPDDATLLALALSDVF